MITLQNPDGELKVKIVLDNEISTIINYNGNSIQEKVIANDTGSYKYITIEMFMTI